MKSSRAQAFLLSDQIRVRPRKSAADIGSYSLTKARDVIMAFQSVSI
jgi:hypothetical protein